MSWCKLEKRMTLYDTPIMHIKDFFKNLMCDHYEGIVQDNNEIKCKNCNEITENGQYRTLQNKAELINKKMELNNY